jgi:hypothetical protein
MRAAYIYFTFYIINNINVIKQQDLIKQYLYHTSICIMPIDYICPLLIFLWNHRWFI